MLKLTNKQYDIVKYITHLGLPVFCSIYIAVVELLHLDLKEEIPIWTVIVVAAFGVVLAFNSSRYHGSDDKYDGYLIVEEDPGGVKRANLIVEGDPEILIQTKHSIIFKVKRED